MDDILTKIKTAQGEFADLFERMDDDLDLARLDEYVMYDTRDQAVPGVVNITLNDPLTFADQVVGNLLKAEMQPEVTGVKLSDKQVEIIEKFLPAVLEQVDELLLQRLYPALRSFIFDQACKRGRIAARCLLREENGDFMPDILPIDTRQIVYKAGPKGLRWIVSIMTRSKDDIEEEYGIKVRQGKTVEVKDYWDAEQNVIFVGPERVRVQPHSYGKPPFIYVVCGPTSMLGDEDYLKYSGESIFAPDRDIYPELNRFASILATLTHRTFRGNYQYRSESGESKEITESPYDEATVFPVEKGGGFDIIPVNDIKAAAKLLYSILEARAQRGALPATDYGNLAFPLSGIAIEGLSQEDRIYAPRLQGAGLFYQQLGNMIVEQYTQGKMSFDLGSRGNKKGFPWSQLDKDFSLHYRFFFTSTKAEAVQYAEASAAKGHVSDDFIRRNILKLQDPDGVKAEMDAEQAERMHPALFMYRRAHALVDEGKPLEARMVAERGVQILLQMMSPSQPEDINKVEPPKAPGGATALAGMAPGQSSRQPSGVGIEGEEGE